MTREEWRKTIRRSCEDAGTYEVFFDGIIDALAGILEVRDTAERQFYESGGSPVVKYTNKGGHTNLRKNPALQIINECNQQALAYWRELGLTVKAFQAMQKNGFKKPETTFEDLLEGIGI